jgi:hypothetical protein
MPRIEPDIRLVAPHHDLLDLPGHDIAWRELGQRVDIRHEPLSSAIQQVGTLTTECFGDEGLGVLVAVQRGGMELDELHVGDLGTGTPRGSEPVAGRDQGIRGHAEYLAAAAGRKDDRICPEGLGPPRVRAVEHERTDTPLPAVSRSTRKCSSRMWLSSPTRGPRQ